MTTKGKWAFVQIGSKKELSKLQKGFIGRKTRIVPTEVYVMEGNMALPGRLVKTHKLERWVE